MLFESKMMSFRASPAEASLINWLIVNRIEDSAGSLFRKLLRQYARTTAGVPELLAERLKMERVYSRSGKHRRTPEDFAGRSKTGRRRKNAAGKKRVTLY